MLSWLPLQIVHTNVANYSWTEIFAMSPFTHNNFQTIIINSQLND